MHIYISHTTIDRDHAGLFIYLFIYLYMIYGHIDVTMCPLVVRGVYLGTHMPLELVKCVFIRYLELKYKQIQEWSLPLRHVERSKMIGP